MASRHYHPDEERFWEKVVKRNSCWEWMAGRSVFGYGQCRFRGKDWQAHRASWVMANGNIPEGMHILHRCDNRACVRPDHLFLGTQADNNHDMMRKGRFVPSLGERNGSAKLTAGHAQQIRELSSIFMMKQTMLGKLFQVTHSTIGRIIRGDGWRTVEG